MLTPANEAAGVSLAPRRRNTITVRRGVSPCGYSRMIAWPRSGSAAKKGGVGMLATRRSRGGISTLATPRAARGTGGGDSRGTGTSRSRSTVRSTTGSRERGGSSTIN